MGSGEVAVATLRWRPGREPPWSEHGLLVGFVTQRREVRRLTLADLDAFPAIWGDPAVILWGASKDLEATRARLRDVIHRHLDGIVDSGWLAVVRRHDGQLVGDVVLQPAPWNRDHTKVSWHVATAWQRRGYATEAATGLLAHAKQHGVDTVPGRLPTNPQALEF